MATSVVQAQSVDNETFYMLVGDDDAFTVTVKGLDGSDENSIDAISTHEDAVTLTGTGEDSFVAAAVGSPTSDGDVNETQGVSITPATDGDAPAAGVYNLTLSVEIDLDTDENATDDDDRTVTSSVTIYVVGGPVEATQFHGDPEVNEGAVAQLLVVQAFHWDMLSGAEMIAAATAGGLSSPSAYGARFADLTAARRANVETLYTTRGVLARGRGVLTLTNDGIDSLPANDDLLNPATDDGQPGEATITVKASDFTGRLIPPGDGSGTVGQDFTVTASLTETGPIAAFTDPDIGPTFAFTMLVE